MADGRAWLHGLISCNDEKCHGYGAARHQTGCNKFPCMQPPSLQVGDPSISMMKSMNPVDYHNPFSVLLLPVRFSVFGCLPSNAPPNCPSHDLRGLDEKKKRVQVEAPHSLL